MANFTACDQLGRMGERVVIMGLSQVYRRVEETPKNITQQLENSDIVCPGFPRMAIPNRRIEVKTELQFTGNFFWETWSNKSAGRRGWGVTSKADELYYLFWETATGYRISALQRKIWLFGYHRHLLTEIKQGKHIQNNDTWGCLIPVGAEWLGAVEFSFVQAKELIEARAA